MSKKPSSRKVSSQKVSSSRINRLYGGIEWLAVAVVAVIALLYFKPWQPAAARPVEITPAEAHQKYLQKTYFLDVRTQEEWNETHIPNTTLIPLDELENRLGELPRGQEIVVVCRSGNRSQQGARILAEAGFTHVSSMSGGIKEWSAAGYPLANPTP